ncbi:MAG TPA: hypothetical protein V6D02_11775, partial [Candidatus Obscuribacterales bacterium]
MTFLCPLRLPPRARSLQVALGGLTALLCLGSPSSAEIVNIGFDTTDLPTLSENELAKLDTLQTVRLPLILSAVSP